MRYTYDEAGDDDDDDEDDDDSENLSTRRSTRNSGVGTPADSRPTTTLSGRQVRSRVGGLYGESLLAGQTPDSRNSPATEVSDEPARASRSGRAGVKERNMDDDTSSGGEWDGGDEDEPDEVDEVMDNLVDDDPQEEESSEEDEDIEPRSLVVTLRYPKDRSPFPHAASSPLPAQPVATTGATAEPVSNGSGLNDHAAPPPTSTTVAPTPPATQQLQSKPPATQAVPQHSLKETHVPPSVGLESIPQHYGVNPLKQQQLPFQRVLPTAAPSVPQHQAPSTNGTV